MALSTSATESLLRAVDIIASSKIGETTYDQTVICSIVDNSEVEKKGFYIVTDGKIRFKAYTNIADYQIGDQVRVTIPNGDYNAKKYIDGPHVSDDDSSAPITYVSPLDNFLSMANLIQPEDNVQGALKANELNIGNQTGIPIWNIKLNDSVYSDLQKNSIYDAIGLSADFKCLLGQYNIKQGNYGLRLDIKVQLNKLDNYIVKSFYLDSSEMFGNPYNFIAPSTQQKLFNTISIGTVNEMTLYFYQNKNFIYYNNDTETLESIPVKDYNIFVNNIQISFGTDIANIEDNVLKMYTLSDTDFNYINPSDQTNLKKVGLLWYNKNDLNQYLGFSDGIVDLDETGNISPYDEIEYLQKSKKNIRLASQLGKEDVPKDAAGLEIAALTEEAFIAVEEIKTLINKDLINALKNYSEKLKERLPEAFAIIDNSYLNKLQSYITKFNDDLQTKQDYLKAMLAHVAKIQRVQNATDYWETTEDKERPSEAPETLNLLNLIGNKFNSLKEIHSNVLNEFSLLVSSDEYQNFKGSYDSFAKSIGDIISLIEGKVKNVEEKAVIIDAQKYEDGQIVIEKTPLETALSWYKPEYYVGIYTPPTEESHSNRYCIYWYRYVPGYIDPNTEFDFGGPEWKRIIPGSIKDDEKIQISSNADDLISIAYNLGLPITYNKETCYWDKKPKNNEGILNIYLEPKMHQEKFKAILFYNHERYESNPIIFTNVDDIVSIEADKTNALSIEHIENSSDTYQTMYSSNNFLINRTNAKKNRAIKAVYNGVLGTSEEVLVDSKDPAHIYWYIPIENTMINVDLDYLTKSEKDGGAGFTTNYVPTYRFKPNVLKRLWKWNEWLKKQASDNNNFDKQLKFLQDKPYGKHISPKLYSFDEWISFLQGNLNSVNPTTDSSNFEDLQLPNAFKGFKRVGNFLSLTEDFSTQELVRDNNTNLTQWGGKWLPFPFKMKLPALDDEGEIIPDSEQNAAEEDLIEEIVDDEHAKDGYAYFYKLIEDIEDTKFFYQIKNYFKENEANNQIICLVEKSNETFEASLNITFGSKGTLGADYNFIIDPALRQSAVSENKPLQVDIALFDYDNKQIPIYEYDASSKDTGVAYLQKTNEKANYIQWIGDAYNFNLKEDENNIVIGGEISFKSENQGIGSILSLTASFKNSESDKETSLPNGAGSDYKKKKLSNITTFYSVPYASADFYIEGATSVIYDSNGNNPDYYKKPYQIFYNYQDSENGELIGQPITGVKWKIVYYSYDKTTNRFVLTNNTEFCENYLPVLNDKNILTPCATYVDDGNSNIDYYAFIQCFNKLGTLIWSQPIIVRKNRYAANMENSYDSSLAINLKSGTIISSLMNAFRRAGTSGTSLEGFVVGEMQYNNETDKNLGLFGFKDGLQTFAFNMDGSMSLGIPGSGQISFDGISGKISSNSSINNKTSENIKSGLEIDLADGIIDIYSTIKDKTTTWFPEEKGIFKTTLTKQLYKLPEGTTVSNALNTHIKINASSGSNNGYEQPKENSFPTWWPKWKPTSYQSTENTSTNQQNSILLGAGGGGTANNYETLFLIEVPKNGKYNPLIAIGDQLCIIQSNNYTTGKYTWGLDDGAVTENGDGMRIDLQYGVIDAYKLKISSSNILINSSGDEEPLFIVRTQLSKDGPYKNLLYIADKGEEFFIQSANYQAKTEVDPGAGLKFDVKRGIIESYNFDLRGESTDGQYKGSFIRITSDTEPDASDTGVPLLHFYLKDSETDIDLLKISPIEFKMNSSDWKENESGMQIDLMAKMITMNKTDEQKLIINAEAEEFPLQIGTTYKKPDGTQSSNLKFRVGWDGIIYLGDNQLQIGNNGGVITEAMTTTNITASEWILSQGHIKSEGYIESGDYIKSGGYIKSTNYISAGTYFYSKGLYIGSTVPTSTTDSDITIKMTAGGNLYANGNVEATKIVSKRTNNDKDKGHVIAEGYIESKGGMYCGYVVEVAQQIKKHIGTTTVDGTEKPLYLILDKPAVATKDITLIPTEITIDGKTYIILAQKVE